SLITLKRTRQQKTNLSTKWRYIMNPRKSQCLFYSMMIIAMGTTLLAGTGAAYAASTSQARSSKCAWQIVPSQNPGNFSNLLTGVAAISTTNVWAVGNYQSN